MRDTHEPDNNFVEKLEWQIGREVRRRNSAAAAPGWITWSRAKFAAAAAALVLVSMAIGGAAVAAAYEAQNNERRDQLASNFEQRLTLAKQRLAMTMEQVQSTERRIAVGLASTTDLLEARIKVAEAEAQVTVTELQLAEVRLTGQAPRTELSSPSVSGRDFVSQRLRSEMTVPRMTLALEEARLQDMQKRVDVGVADTMALEAARVRLLEVQAAVHTFGRKLEIRQKFLRGEADAIETDLRVLEADAEQLKVTLVPKLALARKEVDVIAARVKVGTAQQVELAEATLRRLEHETALSKTELDLALIRAQIQKNRAKS